MVFNNSILAGASGQEGAVESFRFYRLEVTAGQFSTLLIIAEIAILDSSGNNLFPTMTANNAPSPNVTESSSIVSMEFVPTAEPTPITSLSALSSKPT